MDSNTKGCSCGETGTIIVNSNKWYNRIPKKIEKGWGYELILHNGDGYCGKILHFNKGAKSSMHFHLKKHECFYVLCGKLQLFLIKTNIGKTEETIIKEGDIVPINQLLPHQLLAIEESEIFEMSTEDDVNDSYRVWKGDSQK